MTSGFSATLTLRKIFFLMSQVAICGCYSVLSFDATEKNMDLFVITLKVAISY